MHILNIFKPSYYFDVYIDPEFNFLWPIVMVLGAVLVITVILNWRFHKTAKGLSTDQKYWWAHWLNIGYIFSIGSLIHLFFRYESILYLNWRLWPALLVLGIISWIGYLVYYRYRLLPKKRADRAEKKSLAYYFRRRRKA